MECREAGKEDKKLVEGNRRDSLRCRHQGKDLFKIQRYFMIKTLERLGVEETLCIKVVYDKHTAVTE